MSRNMRNTEAPKPHPSLSPLEVVDAQFEALAMGSYAGVEDAYQFLSPQMVAQHGVDLKKFKAVLQSAAFEGLIGVAEWKVLGTSEPSDDVASISLRVLPKPVPGCVRTSGVAAQGGITWPTHYKWILSRQPADAAEHAGCWMLDNMMPDAPPIDVRSREGAEQVAQAREFSTQLPASSRARPASMSLVGTSSLARGLRTTSSARMAAYSTLTVGDRKVIFNEEMGKGLAVDPRHTQVRRPALLPVSTLLG
jgi:hypothetical protein